METELAKFVWPGMPIEQAKKVMEASGFRCSYDREDQSKAFSLICSAHVPEKPWWTRRVSDLFETSLFDPPEIRVLILFEAGNVTKVQVKHDMTFTLQSPEATEINVRDYDQ